MIEASAGIRAYYFGPIDAKRFKFSFKLPPPEGVPEIQIPMGIVEGISITLSSGAY